VTHPQDLSLRAQATAIARGELDPGEFLDLTLQRIAERDRPLNSTPVVFSEESHAMLARAPRGPLYGVPVTVKDMFALPWRGARNGTAAELIPAAASGPFRRLRDAGAVVVGVANQHELGMGTTGTVSAYGPVGNPWNLTHCAGGSSGGSAAAVGARVVAASLGSDSGGSTRLPAAYCGVVGLKVTYRALPYDGYFGMGTTFSAPGAFGRDGADVRVLSEALLSRPLPPGDGRSLRVGVVVKPFWDDTDPAVADACRTALAAAGWAITEVAVDHLELAGTAASVRLLAEAGTPPPWVLAGVSAPTRALLLAALLVPAQSVPRADRVRAAVRRSLAAVFGSVDLLAWPTTAATAPPLAEPWVTLPSGRVPADGPNVRQASLANLCGVPGISVPVGVHPTGLPIGLQLLAPWGEEGRLLDAAEHLERATGRAHVDLVPPIAAAP
jgi:Asp-tRNA(Asn)/Glu-tRNA(Gln) amidotransferase A subunit family amidase